MTSSKTKNIKCFVLFLMLLFPQIAANGEHFIKKHVIVKHAASDMKNENKKTNEMLSILSKDISIESKNIVNNSNTNLNFKKFRDNITSKAILQVATTTLPGTFNVQDDIGLHVPSMNSGALLRGIFVIFGFSLLVIAYMVFRSFRLNKTRTQTVRKYGILANRLDVEMRPLPLDEDDEDDTTVFDASSISSHRLPS